MSYKKFLKSVGSVARLGVSGNNGSQMNDSFYNKYKNYVMDEGE